MGRNTGHGSSDGFVWFDDVRVVLDGLQPMCVVAGKTVPLPVIILHPDCALAEEGDVGRLGVPRQWAKEHGLLGDAEADATPPFDAEVARLTASNATESARRARVDARRASDAATRGQDALAQVVEAVAVAKDRLGTARRRLS